MDQNYTDITIVLDRSGSMSSIAKDTIGGYNTFLKTQQEAPGRATLTLNQFDTEFETVYAAVPIGKVNPLDNNTFVPRGSTALLDAIGRSTTATGARLASLPEDQRPGKVVLVIITDGGENASREFTTKRIQQILKEQQEVYSWEVVFLGANQDAFAVGTSYGIKGANTMTYAASSIGTTNAFRSFSSNLSAVRSSTKVDMSFTDEDKKKQMEAGVSQ